MSLLKIERAVVSVSNKQGIVDFARGLKEFGVEIISTGGTARTLKEAGIEVTEVSEVTKFPEILEGRVKTLHPLIFGGILANREKELHLKEMEEMGIPSIDMVVVNLYPFKEVTSKPDVSMEEAIENIDIGGVTLLRAAAKNYRSCVVICDHHRYDEIIEEMKKNGGAVSLETRFDLAKEVFEHTADYDETIHHFLAGKEDEFPAICSIHLEKVQDLRYGENPHQKAALYREIGSPRWTLVQGEQLHGKGLSFNNILDMDAAWLCVKEFSEPACVIVKHTNPCGVGMGKNLIEAYDKALASDPVSAFGGIVALNKVLEEGLAKKIAERFYEIVIAPAFVEEALEVLIQKKNLRLIYMGEDKRPRYYGRDYRRVEGGLLVQDYDLIEEERSQMKVVTEREPSEEEWRDLLFVWKAARHVKSNAIVLGKNLATVGVGAGQMSRIDAFWISVKKAGEKAKGSVLASDAFFPFSDVVEAAAKEGITAIIQPGGALRDQESIDAANKAGIAMVFTGKRHFRH
jgi:phosphoribosylaminoimidazolecarboxamide formyltransferase/IMP cyclohydrolase